MNFINRILLGIISVACFLSASAQNSGSAQLAELEKEKSYQIIREYIDYAKENDLRIPMAQIIKDYLKLERNKELDVILYKGSDDVLPKSDLDAVWALYNSYALEFKELYMAVPGAAELEKDYKAKYISRDDYNERRSEYQRMIMKDNPDAIDLAKKYSIAYPIALQSSLSLILKDYIRQDIAVPTDWIPGTIRDKLLKTKRVKAIQKHIDALNK